MQVSMNDYNRILNIVLRPECIVSLIDDKVTPAKLVQSIYEGLQSASVHFIEDDKVYIRVSPFIGTSGQCFLAATKEFRGKQLIDYMKNIIKTDQFKKLGITKFTSFVRSDNKAAMICNSYIGMKQAGKIPGIVPKNGKMLDYIIYEREV